MLHRQNQATLLKTILVLSGITSAEDLAKSEVKPTWIFDDIVALAAALN